MEKQLDVVSNLITDMTIKGATDEELCRAVKHSMVVIDAVKHKLGYKQSEIDNDIESLKKKYQSNELSDMQMIDNEEFMTNLLGGESNWKSSETLLPSNCPKT